MKAAFFGEKGKQFSRRITSSYTMEWKSEFPSKSMEFKNKGIYLL